MSITVHTGSEMEHLSDEARLMEILRRARKKRTHVLVCWSDEANTGSLLTIHADRLPPSQAAAICNLLDD